MNTKNFIIKTNDFKLHYIKFHCRYNNTFLSPPFFSQCRKKYQHDLSNKYLNYFI